ncbi:unnamed protein product [Allacma fusca]|uniref:Uncharacterized protein n=1 Tax=Allacma fusca TaxID=39272 RepID=A0A8J2P663_9HEXA|nr:unnamed protein product [Allacma fusca]
MCCWDESVHGNRSVILILYGHPPGAIVKYVSGSMCAERVADTIKFSNINFYGFPVKTTLNDCNKGVLDDVQKGFMEKIRNVCGLTILTRVVCKSIGLLD